MKKPPQMRRLFLVIVGQIPTMFSVITWGFGLFISPCSFTHFVIKSPKLIFATGTILHIKVRITVIHSNLFSFSCQLFISAIS